MGGAVSARPAGPTSPGAVPPSRGGPVPPSRGGPVASTAPAKASFTRIEGAQAPQTLEAPWNPSSYTVRRGARLLAAEALGAPGRTALLAGGGDELRAELFVDTTGEAPGERDARRSAEVLRGWMDAVPGSLLP